MSCVIRIDAGNHRHFDVIATDSIGTEIGRLEGDYVGDGDPSEDRFWIGNCWVHRDHRRRGIGSEMVRRAIEEAAKRYATRFIFIDVSPIDEAPLDGVRAFWTSNGFVDAAHVRITGRRFYGSLMIRTELRPHQA